MEYIHPVTRSATAAAAAGGGGGSLHSRRRRCAVRVRLLYMAASLGLAHDACYAAYYPLPDAAAASSCFPSPPPPGGLVADHPAEFPPPPAAAAMLAEDYYFGQEMAGGAPVPVPGCGGSAYCSPPAPVFDNGMSLLSYGGVDGNGRRPVNRPAGGSGGGRPASRIGFRTRSEVDVLDDGFKWRKYGKKAVKSSPNPRNYYRCSAEGCGVKKRVERDSHDPRYVVTTYDGVHNHAAPGAAYLCLPPRGATATATPCFSPPRSVSAPAPLVAPPSWRAAFDAWEAQLHAAAAAAHSSESSY